MTILADEQIEDLVHGERRPSDRMDVLLGQLGGPAVGDDPAARGDDELGVPRRGHAHRVELDGGGVDRVVVEHQEDAEVRHRDGLRARFRGLAGDLVGEDADEADGLGAVVRTEVSVGQVIILLCTGVRIGIILRLW